MTLLLVTVLGVFSLLHRTRQLVPFTEAESGVDLWLHRLTAENPDGSAAAPVKITAEFVFETYQATRNGRDEDWQRRFIEMLLPAFPVSFKESSDYIHLADSLFRARERVRLTLPLESARSGIFFLSQLTDEILYAMTVRFPEQARALEEWRIGFESPSLSCKERKVGKYFGFDLCAGDVVLSKSEAFSSSLFAFRSPLSGTFSHASMPYFTSQMHSPLLMEAEPTGGLFEDPSKEGQLPKIAVYRLSDSTENQRDKIDRALSEIVALRGSTARFNFSLNPRCEPGRYFCTEIVYCTYRQSGLAQILNPYNESLWSAAAPEAKEFIEQISSSYSGPIPMPGDVELNSAFKPVGFAVKLDQIPTLRIQMAIVEAFRNLMHTDSQLRGRYLGVLNRFGDQELRELTASTGALDFLGTLGLPMKDKLSLLRGQLPMETKLKEIAFYFHFQNRMLPQITQKLLTDSSRFPQQTVTLGELKKLALPELRRGTEEFISLFRPF